MPDIHPFIPVPWIIAPVLSLETDSKSESDGAAHTTTPTAKVRRTVRPTVSIVFVSLGKHPAYLKDAIDNCLMFHDLKTQNESKQHESQTSLENRSAILSDSRGNFENRSAILTNPHVKFEIIVVGDSTIDEWKQLGCDSSVQFIHIAALKMTDIYQQFEKKITLDMGFRDGYFRKVKQRFFVLERFMHTFPDRHVIHLENDVMTYVDYRSFYDTWIKHPMMAPIIGKEQGVPGLVWFREPEACTHFLSFSLPHFDKMDMEWLRMYMDTYPDKLAPLPIYPSDKYGEVYSRHYKDFGETLFDAAPIAQLLYGVDPRNRGGKIIKETRPESDVNYPTERFEWQVDSSNRLVLHMKWKLETDDTNECKEKTRWIPIHCLHMHSKELFKVRSDVSGMHARYMATQETYARHDAHGVPLDVKLKTILSKKTFGTFVDIGCYDGSLQSTTRLLEEYLGWTGLLVDANELVFHKARFTRCFSQVVQCALVSNEYKESTIKGAFINIRGRVTPMGKTQVPAKTLMTVLKEANLMDKPIDFMTISVNGTELDVLKGMDWNARVLPTHILVTVTSRASKKEIIEYMTARKYRIVNDSFSRCEDGKNHPVSDSDDQMYVDDVLMVLNHL